MNQFEDEQHIFMPNGRNDTKYQQCDLCGKPFGAHQLDTNEMKIVQSGASFRPPITWKYTKKT